MDQLKSLLDRLDAAGVWLAPLLLRLILAKEFWDAGIGKLNGHNWFIDIQHQFPFPFSVLPPEISWHLASGLEILGALALLLGLGTRFFALALAFLTLVAIATVHAGGYTLGAGGWKLPLIYLAMLLPLILSGPGKLSVDHWLRPHFLKTQRRLWS
jgi:putative oxidoreductase